MTIDPARRAQHPHPAAPGRLLLHPLAITALVILIVNDHILKTAIPSTLTGKLSDVAGLLVFPLLLATIIEVVRPRSDRCRPIVVATALTVVAFTVVKTTDVGASLFGWSLGLGQWVLTLGPLRDAQLAPAAVVADATDLLALPAVLVASWIAMRRPFAPRPWPSRVRTRPSAAALAMLVVAGLATMATSQGLPTTSTEFQADLHLTKDAPVAVRHLDFTVAPGKDHIQAVTLTGGVFEHATEDGSEYLAPSVGARLSIIPDTAGIEIPVDQGFMSSAFDLTKLCATGCEHGVTLVVRLAPSAPDSLDVVLDASIFATDDYREGQDQEMDTALTLVEDVDRRFDGAPSSLLTIASGSIEVGTDDPDAHSTITLTVEGAALRGPLSFPLVGHLTVNVVSEAASGHPYAANMSLGFQDAAEPIYLSSDVVPVDLDWLARCSPGTDCTVTLDIDSTYEPWLNAPESDESDPAAEPTESSPGFVRLAWTVEARLEAFDGRTLPATALVLAVK